MCNTQRKPALCKYFKTNGNIFIIAKLAATEPSCSNDG